MLQNINGFQCTIGHGRAVQGMEEIVKIALRLELFSVEVCTIIVHMNKPND